jgi:aminoglycoside phosphotransferase (APT) family kinase protein
MENSWIPAGKEAAVARALDRAFPGKTLGTAAPVRGGASGAHIFRLEIDAQSFVMRIESGRDAYRDPARHYTCLAIAAEGGVAPRLHYANPEDGVAIIDFVPADDGPSLPERLTVIARTLRALHDTPTFPALVDHLDGLGHILLHVRDVLATDVAAQQAQLYQQCLAAYPRGELEIVSSHNDCNPSNLLFQNGRLWLVDFESSFAADRYVDLGALANFLQLSESGEDQLLSVYFGQAPTGRQKDRLALARQVARIFYSAVLLRVAAWERPGFRLTTKILAPLQTRGLNGALPTVMDFDGKLRLAGALFNEALAMSVKPYFVAALARLSQPA